MTAIGIRTDQRLGWVDQLNRTWHEKALWAYMAIVLLHWMEHIFQAAQIWLFNMPRPEALGGIGYLFPVLVRSEIMHFGFALLMIVGLILLLPGFQGRARTWWSISLGIQAWHFVEHSILQWQAAADVTFFGSPVPASVFQLWIPRPELHLIYNAAVFIPMVVAMWLHTRPDQAGHIACSCAD